MAESPIRCVATFGVNPGQLEQVKAVVGDISDVAARVPVGSFAPVFSGDESSVELTFTFASHHDLDMSVSSLGPEVERLATVAHLTDLHVYGELREKAMAALAPFGPTIHAFAS